MGRLAHIVAQYQADENSKAQKKEKDDAIERQNSAIGKMVEEQIRGHLLHVLDAFSKADAKDEKRDAAAKKVIEHAVKSISNDVSEVLDSFLAALSSQEERIIQAIRSIPKPKDPPKPEKVDISPILKRLEQLSEQVAEPFDIQLPETPKSEPKTVRVHFERGPNGFMKSPIEFTIGD